MLDTVESYNVEDEELQSVQLKQEERGRITKFGAPKVRKLEENYITYFRGFGTDAEMIYETMSLFVDNNDKELVDFDNVEVMTELIDFIRYYLEEGEDIDDVLMKLYDHLLQGKRIPWDFDYLTEDKLNYIQTSDYSLIKKGVNYKSDRPCPNKGCGSSDVSFTTVQTRSGDEGWTAIYTCVNCGINRGQ